MSKGKALAQLLEVAPTALKLGIALLAAVGGDEDAALKAIRETELRLRKERDERMGR